MSSESSTVIYALWSRDNNLACPVHSTDRDWLTTHSDKTLLAFNQIWISGLKSRTDRSDSTRPLRSYWIDLQYNFEFTQRIRRDFLHVCWHGTCKDYYCWDGPWPSSKNRRVLTLHHACTMHCPLSTDIFLFYSIGCATALPMGVAPEIVLYCFGNGG